MKDICKDCPVSPSITPYWCQYCEKSEDKKLICEVSGLPYWCSLCPELDEIEEGCKCPKGVIKHVENNIHQETEEPKQRTTIKNQE